MNSLPTSQSESGRFTRAAGLIVLAAAILAAAGWIWIGWCGYPDQKWNTIRLAPSFMLAHGVSPYPGPEAGPVTTWIYGPVSIFLHLPVTLASNVITALLFAAVLNSIFGLTPIWLVARAEAGPRAIAVAGWAFLLAVAAWPGVNLTFYQVDNIAVAFGLLGCLCLHGAGLSSPWRLWAAAAAAAFAVWSKQTELAPALGQVAYLFLQRGSRAAAAQAVRCAVIGALLGLAFLPLFGAEGLIYNMFVLPGHLPTSDLFAKAILPGHRGFFIAYVLLPFALVAGHARRVLARDNFLSLYSLVFLFSLPFNLAGFAGIGGSTNSLHGALYLIPAGAVWLVRRTAHWTRGVRLVPLALMGVALALQSSTQWPLATRPRIEGLREGMQLARQLPGQVYFPWNPLLTIYSDGRFDHAEDGLNARAAIGRPVPPAVFLRYLPPSYCAVAYDRQVATGPVYLSLPAEARRGQFGEWIVFSWAPPHSPANPAASGAPPKSR